MSFFRRKFNYQIIVIGAGAAGLVIAIGAAKAGKKVLLIEKGPYGGDCTNFGCIPSKSLIAAAHVANHINHFEEMGLKASLSQTLFDGALKRSQEIVHKIRKEEEPEALHKKGVETLTGTASFHDPHTLKVLTEDGKEQVVSAKDIVIATGSSPRIPDIPGLKEVPYQTNETIFELTEIPKHLGILGGGPIGSELAQAFRRLGAKVSLVQHSPNLLKKEEPEAQQLLKNSFLKEGIDLYLSWETEKISQEQGEIILHLKQPPKNGSKKIAVSHLFIATGRMPNVNLLNLDSVQIKQNKRGVVVDQYGRASYKHIWACGDIAGHAIFTHVAENEARTILRNLLLPKLFKAKLDLNQSIPRVTYTDPEIAAIGMKESEALAKFGENKIATYFFPFSALDRAITEGREEGFIKVITKKWTSRILGATIAGPRAGEMLLQISTAMAHKIPLRKLASLIHPYPTYSLAIRKAADQWLTKTILPALLKIKK